MKTNKRLRERTRRQLISKHLIPEAAIDDALEAMSGKILLGFPEGETQLHAYHVLTLPIDGEMRNVLFGLEEFEDGSPEEAEMN